VTARRAAGGLGLVGLAGLTFLALQASSRLRATWPPEADTFYIPAASALRVVSLGHHELAADLVAARANVYFGTQLMSKGGQKHLLEYVDRAVDLDPYFHRLYLSGAAMVVYNGKNVDLATGLTANALLERGTQAFPMDWEILFQLGFNYLFELPKLGGADHPRAAQWRQRGVEAFRKAALFEGVPDWLPNLVARMLTKSGQDEMALRHLEQAYALATSDQARTQIALELDQLRGKQASLRIVEEHRRFEEDVVARYPYAPDAFSAIAGPRAPRWVDLGQTATAPRVTARNDERRAP
jgi:tetratricopeptide (TPR) repeat protein